MINKKIILDQIKISLSPIKKYLSDDNVTDIIIYNANKIYVKYTNTDFIKVKDAKWNNDKDLLVTAKQIGRSINRRIDEENPILDARLPDMSRVNICVPPVYPDSGLIVIRKFPETNLTFDDLINYKTLNKNLVEILKSFIYLGKNIIIAGRTGTGKTTVLNLLANEINKQYQVVTCEENLEIRLNRELWTRLETTMNIFEPEKSITLKDLVKTSLRLIPEWVILGEVRGGEVVDMLRAFNTGHNGICTVHANSALDSLKAFEMLYQQEIDTKIEAIQKTIARSIDIVIFINRFKDNRRIIENVIEINDLEIVKDRYEYITNNLFNFELEGYKKGKSYGKCHFLNKPSFFKEYKLNDIDIPQVWRKKND